jgi:hypothetical protein
MAVELINWLAKQKQKGCMRYIAERRETVGAQKEGFGMHRSRM